MFVSTDAIYQYTVIYDLVFSHNPTASILFVASERMRPKANMNPHMLGCCDIAWQHRDSLTVLLHPPVAQADHTYMTTQDLCLVSPKFPIHLVENISQTNLCITTEGYDITLSVLRASISSYV